METNIFIGVAWPYVNGDLHIGHLAGYLLPADIFARYNRCVGNNVLMVSGSDCFGTPITIEADKEKTSPQIIADTYHKKDEELLLKTLSLTYDLYTKTTTDQHIRVVQDFFVKMLEHGYIFIDTSKQYYSETENKFLPDRYVVGKCPSCGFDNARSDQCDSCGNVLNQGDLINPVSTISKSPVVLKNTQHYFIDWPKLQNKIGEYVKSHKALWKEWVASEATGWLQEGLKPRAITRDLDWGVPIPVDRLPKDKVIDGVSNKRIYVWFDAVIGYYSASLLWSEKTGNSVDPFWNNNLSKHYYFMGKDNLVFHSLFWPGQLMAYDEKLHLPDVCSTNMFLDLEGKKFSKSRGITIDVKDFVEKFGNDRTRFYISYIMPETRDTSFSWIGFKDTINGVLIANLGNFINRVLSVGFKNKVSSIANYPESNIIETVCQSFGKAKDALDNCRFRDYIDVILNLSTLGNKICDEEKIWALQSENPEKFGVVIANLYFIVGCLAYLINPLLPDASIKLTNQLYGTLIKDNKWPEQVDESFITKIMSMKVQAKPEPLFSKVELENLGSDSPK